MLKLKQQLRRRNLWSSTSIFDFEDEEEAINIANSTKYGLASGVFTADDQKAKWTADRIQAGIIWQNDWFVDGSKSSRWWLIKSQVMEEMED